MSVKSGSTTVHPGRIRVMKSGSNPNGPVVYWMFRDQRVNDNWALIHAVNEANKRNSPISVAFNLFDAFKGANARQLGFMLRGLKQLQSSLFDSLHIPFFLFQGEAVDTIPEFLAECKASLLVTDFTPLREIRKCKEEICKRVGDSVSIHEVDAHNVVPVWKTSSKLEYATRTITSKINELLPTYLTDFPTLVPPNMKWASSPPTIHWDQLIEDRLKKGAEVPEIYWCEPGETAALEVLKGSQNGFLTKRLKDYAISWNKPFNPNAQSGLSPYLHFGQISAQRCAVERILSKFKLRGFGAFFEELIVRRELADNFCYYQPHYDSLMGAWEWARKTLMDHISDKREHLYTTEQLEKAQTADQLWNASQLEMVHYGKMHGFMRMYWGKKLLDWTSRPEEALATAIYLNDKYEIDGRDPNGYVGCMWSMCGVHDQAWREHPISGKVRFMDYACCKRRFDVKGYISYVENLVAETTKRKTEAEAEISLDQMEKEPCRLDLSLFLSLSLSNDAAYTFWKLVGHQLLMHSIVDYIALSLSTMSKLDCYTIMHN